MARSTQSAGISRSCLPGRQTMDRSGRAASPRAGPGGTRGRGEGTSGSDQCGNGFLSPCATVNVHGTGRVSAKGPFPVFTVHPLHRDAPNPRRFPRSVGFRPDGAGGASPMLPTGPPQLVSCARSAAPCVVAGRS